MGKIVVYSTASCPYCMMAKELLEDKGAFFEPVFIDRHPEYVDEMVEKSGGRKTVPQIFIDGYHVGGYDELKDLDDKGKLESLL